MSLRINSESQALNAHRQVDRASEAVARSMQRLSSGLRITSGRDDAAGLGISERMRAQISGIAQAKRNIQDGISLLQTAEGVVQEFTAIIHRIRDLSVQYNNGLYSAADRAMISIEINVLGEQMGLMSMAAQFNGIPLIGVPPGSPLVTLQVGPNATDVLAVQGGQLTAAAAAVQTFYSVDFVSPTFTTIQIDTWDNVLDMFSTLRAEYGAVQNRLEHAMNFLSVQEEQLMSAESRIRDVDMASEMVSLTQNQIRQQASTAMLAQANAASAVVLDLLP